MPAVYCGDAERGGYCPQAEAAREPEIGSRDVSTKVISVMSVSGYSLLLSHPETSCRMASMMISVGATCRRSDQQMTLGRAACAEPDQDHDCECGRRIDHKKTLHPCVSSESSLMYLPLDLTPVFESVTM